MDRNIVRAAAAAAVLVAGLAAAGPAQAATGSAGRISSAQLQAHLAKAVTAESKAAIGSGPISGFASAIKSVA
jgi:ubiquinone biosynthesis protein UbiJ